MYDLNGEYKVISLLHAQALTSTASSTAVDFAAYEQDTLIVLDLGAAVDATATLDVIVRGSATSGGTYTTLLTFNQLLDTDDNKIAAGKILRTTAAMRWIKVTATIALGTTPSFTIAVFALAKAVDATGVLNSVAAA